MTHKIKVVLSNEPGISRELLKSLIQRQTDMEVVGEVLDPIKLLLTVGETQADVVVLTLAESDEYPGICSHLFFEYPQLLILALSARCDSAFVYQQRISKEQLPSKSDSDLLAAIRKARV